MCSICNEPLIPKPNPSDGNIYIPLVPNSSYTLQQQDKPVVLTRSLPADQLAFDCAKPAHCVPPYSANDAII